MTRFALTLAVVAACLLPSFLTASADAASTGSLSVAPAGPGQLSVTGSATYDCAGNLYCGWFATVADVPAGQPCNNIDLDYVGEVTEVATASFSSTFLPNTWAFSYPSQPPLTLCLYVNGAFPEELVAQTTYSLPPPPPPPAPVTYAPPPSAPPASTPDSPSKPKPQARTLSASEAKAGLRGALRRRWGRKFTRGTGYRSSCHRLSRLRMKCRASWNYKGRWRVTATVRATAKKLYWHFTTHKPAKPAPAPTPPASSPPPSGGGGFCDTHSCIPNFDNGTGYIVQCNDGMWSHSGGRQGACSGHGGESGITASAHATHRGSTAESMRRVMRGRQRLAELAAATAVVPR